MGQPCVQGCDTNKMRKMEYEMFKKRQFTLCSHFLVGDLGSFV